jgi:hypothetical protein
MISLQHFQSMEFSMIRLWVLMIISGITTTASADFDPAGPSVDWTGQIVSQAPQNNDTCFTLRRSQQNATQNTPETFKACAFGSYNAREFQPGHWLEVRGILQPKNSDNLPCVGAANAIPTQDPDIPVAYPDPMFYPSPFGPFGAPFGNPMMYPGGFSYGISYPF